MSQKILVDVSHLAWNNLCKNLSILGNSHVYTVGKCIIHRTNSLPPRRADVFFSANEVKELF